MADTRSKAAKAADDNPTGDAKTAVGDVDDKMNEAAEKGYFGHSPDPTPPENYTLQGVTSGKPTPETERKA